MAGLGTVGIYREMYSVPKEGLPSLREASNTQPLTDRQAILDYMRAAPPVFDVLEDVVDLFDNTTVIPGGSSLLSDGQWIWRVDSIHYLATYRLAFPEPFLYHVRGANYQPPAAAPDNDEFDAAVLTYF
ncbi:hypothetical protein IU487_10810 [Nocardia puris]|uniref:hypothetical protein n=1 Tax=Nocardia puris TaxID=208602 RepID=UPI0018933125|nr:hypothetical protein [Nocardia puris]MBF6211536.1 hypothetical protein [Nocardia puris]